MTDASENIEWSWIPSPPETLIGRLPSGLEYHFECVGTVPAGEDEKGDLLRVWIPWPDEGTDNRVVADLEERHGVYAEREEYADLDGYTGRGPQIT